MKPIEYKNLIKARHLASIIRPLYAEGMPGVGKTEIPKQAAAEMKIDCRVIHAPLLQPEDYSFPVISVDRQNVTFVVAKEKFPIEGSECGDVGILIIDELAQADANAQKILRNLIQAREIHGHKLKKGWSIIATGNRVIDRAGANRLLSHLSNVLTRVTLEPNLDDWTQWALANGVRPEVVAFIRFKPDLLSNFDPNQEINATPRAWTEGVSAALGAIDPTMELTVFSGDVGQGPASEFLAFLKIYRKLPSPDAIIMSPEKAVVPDDLSTLYALCGALSHRTAPDNFGRIMKYIKRIPAEFGVLYVKDAIARCPEIQQSKDFIAWASSDGAKLLT